MSEPMAYVARMACGHIVAAAVDDEHKKDNAREIARWIRWGYTVDRVTCEQVRTVEVLHRPGRCPNEAPKPATPVQAALL